VTEAWEPANGTEHALARAAAAGDRREFCRLIAEAELVLPRFVHDNGGEGQRFVTATVLGETYLLVYTSVAGMRARLPQGVDGYSMTTYAELRSRWPSPDWRLAVNAGSPLEAYLAVDAVERAAAGEVVVPTMAELVDDAQGALAEPSPVDDVESVLAAAAADADVDRYVAALLDAPVLVPTERVVPDAAEILEPGFPWRRVGPPEHPVIEVFTSPARLEQAHPEGGPAVTVALSFALAVWPADCGLSVDPGDPTGIEVASDQVLWLLLWGAPESAREADEEDA
jgi:hypothetical protein